MRRAAKHARIILESEGFRFEGMDECCVHWAGVRRITAHKLDLVTSDEIRLVFENDGEASRIEVSEEQPGFEHLRLFAEEKFGFPQGWWEAVLKPAFASSAAILFVRAEPGHADGVRNARA